MPFHAQRQGFDSLQEQESVHGRDRSADIAQQLHPCLEDVRTCAEGRPVGQPVVARIGLGEHRMPPRGAEVERAAVDDEPADGGAVTADELGGRMHHDVRTVGQRLAQVRRWHRVVDDQRNAHRMGHVGHAFEVQDVVLGIADGLAVERPRVVTGRIAPCVEVVGIFHKRGLDAHLRQRVVEQVVRAPIQRRAGHDVVARLRKVEDCQRLRSLPRGHRQRAGQTDCCANAPFERTDALFQHMLGGVHDAGVDVPDLSQSEQLLGMLGALEGVRGGLVDGNRAGVGGAVRRLARVDHSGFETPLVGLVFNCVAHSELHFLRPMRRAMPVTRRDCRARSTVPAKPDLSGRIFCDR